MNNELFIFCLRLADNCLILAHRQSELCSKSPFLEEDIAQTNFGLDLLGQAEAIYNFAAEIEGNINTPDDLVYKRNERSFYNFILSEQPNTDFAFVVIRQYFMSVYLKIIYTTLSNIKDSELSGISLKALKELDYQINHFELWIKRLGLGTKESKEKIQNAINELWIFTGELFERDNLDLNMEKNGYLLNSNLFYKKWINYINDIFNKSNLNIPKDAYMITGSKNGIHSEYMGFILTEMQFLQRTFPDAKW
ncbi:MAG: phenylacetate-CoA oxygenase subunit PaaI [Flavobacteriales bacterium]|nr:phenylacetate-CoA oxygenase subunit PaaI [Flavobacteriales bacterium]|tara:strand:+ start:2374 stop:3126 length:753 start_codon:yes stop_codon:yes gene_type:complete